MRVTQREELSVSVEWQASGVSNVRVGHVHTLIWPTDWLSDYILMADFFYMYEIMFILK